MRFEFATATRILFGPGVVSQVAPLAASLGHRAFVVVDGAADRAAPLLPRRKAQCIKPVTFSKVSSMKGNPLPLTDQELSEILRQAL